VKVLLLGGSGMLGHKLWQTLSAEFDCWATFRQPFQTFRRFRLFDEGRSLCGVDLSRRDALEEVFARVRPQAVVNAVGIVKQLKEAYDPVPSLEVNALLPHYLARLCARGGARLIHVSTDCVFSGQRGHYTERDTTDATDLYGRTKALGEVAVDGCLTLRTSMIGRELLSAHGLVEWFLAQRGKTVRGFARAVFSGLVTADLARVIARILREHPGLSGLYHLAATPINKYDLLCLVRDRFRLPVTVERDETFHCDRSLDGSRFREATGISAPSWPEMIDTLWSDSHLYDDWKKDDRA
jgi:dTDP-4-dehydrorhamnose reductase